MQDVVDVNKVNGKTYNIRVSFDSNGTPILNWCHGMFKESEHVTEIRRVSESEHLAIALALGIRHSSVHRSINRKLRVLSKKEQEAERAVNTLLSSLEAVEISENSSKNACNA